MNRDKKGRFVSNKQPRDKKGRFVKKDNNPNQEEIEAFWEDK